MSNEEEETVSAEVNYEFAVKRWAKTMQHISVTEGRDEVIRRTAGLPKAFEERLISFINGEDNGKPY